MGIPYSNGLEPLTQRAQRYFWIITIPSLIFSPLGEEIFFRGFLQQAVEQRFNHRTGVIVDAGWFAAVPRSKVDYPEP